MNITAERFGSNAGVFRLHVRPGRDSSLMTETFAYCLKQGILGVGWRTLSNTNTKDWGTYYTEANNIHDDLRICEYIKSRISEGCLVWTRDTQSNYYLARVLSGWEYFTTEESLSRNIDIGNVFRVAFKKLSADEVPGKVVASFRARRTLQAIADPTAIAYSKFLWNQKAGNEVYAIDEDVFRTPDIFSLLDSEEVEDIIFLYLQSKGWFVVPNSRKADTLAFEYFVVRPQDGSKAHVQIKTGGVKLNRDLYRNLSFPVILFQSSDLYLGEPSTNVTCLSRAEIENFLRVSAHWLPARYQHKMTMLQGR